MNLAGKGLGIVNSQAWYTHHCARYKLEGHGDTLLLDQMTWLGQSYDAAVGGAAPFRPQMAPPLRTKYLHAAAPVGWHRARRTAESPQLLSTGHEPPATVEQQGWLLWTPCKGRISNCVSQGRAEQVRAFVSQLQSTFQGGTLQSKVGHMTPGLRYPHPPPPLVHPPGVGGNCHFVNRQKMARCNL